MIRIRPYMAADESSILKWCENEETYYRWSFGLPGPYPPDAEHFKTTESCGRFTALADGEPAGFFTIRNPQGRLEELRFGYVIVDPGKRRQGIGRKMLLLGLSFAFGNYGAERVSLGVSEDNLPARTCYRSLGFTETGRTETWSVGGRNLIADEMAIRRDEYEARSRAPAGDDVHPELLRAEEEWQRAGAYAVRVEGMNRQHHIPLREEFDAHDGDGTRYIVLLDDGYPFATCRFYDDGNGRVCLGRVVVLPRYRGMDYGRRLLEEAENWIRECGYQEILVDARVTATGFYRKAGYTELTGDSIISGPFECVRMHKML